MKIYFSLENKCLVSSHADTARVVNKFYFLSFSQTGNQVEEHGPNKRYRSYI
jgi:hypothetical protein